MRLFAVVPAVVCALMILPGCSSPTAPTPEMVILTPKPNMQLRIGDTVTVSWKCQDCDGVKASFAKLKLNRQVSAGQFDTVGEIAQGFLTDSRSWNVGVVDYHGPNSSGRITVEPGFYFIEVSSYPAPDATTWTEATSGFDGVAIELVR
jgi:hypothetical protein